MSRRIISIDDEYPAGLDFAGLVAALVCSDEIIIDSPRLDEVVLLAQKFGPDGVQDLFHSGRIKCLSEITQPFASDPAVAALDGTRSSRSQTDRIRLGFLTRSDPLELVNEGIEQIHQIEGLPEADRTDIAAAVAPHVIAGGNSRSVLPELIANDLGVAGHALKAAILREAADRTKKLIEPSALKVEVTRFEVVDGADLVEVRSNIGILLGLPMRESFNLVQSAVLSVAAFDYRLEQGSRLEAMPEFRPTHLPLLDAKAQVLMSKTAEATRKEKLVRVGRIAGIPHVSSDPARADIDIQRLLALCGSDQIVEFRRWLDNSGDLTESEIEKETASAFDRVASVAASSASRTTRELVLVTAGLALPAAVATGLTIADKLLFGAIGKPGPAASVRKLKKAIS